MCQASSHANFSSSSKIRISSGIAKTGCVSLMWIAIFHVVDEGHHIFLYAFERYFANLLIRGNTVVLNEVFFPHHAYHLDIKTPIQPLFHAYISKYLCSFAERNWFSIPKSKCIYSTRLIANYRHIIWHGHNDFCICMPKL